MRVQVKLFAVARQLAGQETIDLELPQGAKVADVRRQLGEQVPDLKPLLAQMMFALGTDYANDSTEVSEASELACIPPVSGG